MATDQNIIDAVRHAFAAEPHPEHFTDHRHCCECAEHKALLASHDLDSLHLEDVNNAGWDPICFVTAAGFRSYLPALVRLIFDSVTLEDWYLPQLLFHLTYDGPQNRRVICCTAGQQRAIAAALWYVIQTQPALIVRYGIEDDLQRALEIWSAPEIELSPPENVNRAAREQRSFVLTVREPMIALNPRYLTMNPHDLSTAREHLFRTSHCEHDRQRWHDFRYHGIALIRF